MAVTDQQIVDYLTSNPNLTSQELSAVMAQYGVTPEQVVNAIGATGTAPVNVAGTYYQPIYSQIGAGEGYQQGPLENLVTYKANENNVGGNVNWFDPTGNYQQTTKQQEVNANQDFLKFLAGSAALFGGLGGGSLWGGAGTAADAAAAAADADIAGGLIPEFGTNAAYDAFMSGAMTPAALASLEELIAANPEILGSGALLTDAAAGLTPSGVIPSGSTTVATVPSTGVTPTTPAVKPTVTPSISSVLPSILPSLTPSVIAGLTGLLGGKLVGGSSTPQTGTTPVSTPTQGVPLNSQDYFNAIQQNYNQIMPNVPRDVATPLAAWYNSKYGA